MAEPIIGLSYHQHHTFRHPDACVLRKLPPIPTIHTLTKRRHRLISTPSLRLRITNLTHPALSTLQLRTDTLLFLSNHGCAHVLLLESSVLSFHLFALHFFVAHLGELCGSD